MEQGLDAPRRNYIVIASFSWSHHDMLTVQEMFDLIVFDNSFFGACTLC